MPTRFPDFTALRLLARRMQFDRAGLVAAFRTFLTAWCAFALASLLHVENAYWAGMAAWIVMQPTRGILIERGINRIAGTLVGAAAGFAMLNALPDPHYAVTALAVWIALCATLTHVFRRAHSYGAMLAGITAVVVVLPTLHAHEQSFELAQARVLCTLIGVVVATVSGLLFVPRAAQRAFLNRLDILVAEVITFAARHADQRDTRGLEQHARSILDEMAALEQALAIHAAGSRRRQHQIHRLSALIGLALELMAAARSAAECRQSAAPASVQALLQKLADGFRTHAPVAQALEPVHAFDARQGAALRELLAARADFAQLSGLGRARFAARIPADKDYVQAATTGAAAGLALWLASHAALASSWHFAPLAALGVGNFAIILAAMERPHWLAPRIFAGVTLGVIAATVFRLFVLPHATSNSDVLLMVIPFMVLGALLRANRLTSLPAVDYNMCFLLAGQPFLPAETSASIILQSSAALVLGCGFVALGHVLAPRNPGRRVRRISARIIADLQSMADMASASAPDTHPPALMAQRLLRLSIHLSRSDNLRESQPVLVLAALNLAHGLMELRTQIQDPARSEGERALLRQVIAGFRTLHSAQQALPAPGKPLETLPADSQQTLHKLARALERFAPLLEAGRAAR